MARRGYRLKKRLLRCLPCCGACPAFFCALQNKSFVQFFGGAIRRQTAPKLGQRSLSFRFSPFVCVWLRVGAVAPLRRARPTAHSAIVLLYNTTLGANCQDLTARHLQKNGSVRDGARLCSAFFAKPLDISPHP